MNSHSIELRSDLRYSHPMDEISSSVFRRAESRLIVAVDAVLDFLQSGQERAVLMRLNDRELKDIGLSRSAIGGTDHPPAPLN